MSTLLNIQYYITIYIGISIYYFGLIGGLFNIYILFPNRTNPCTFLLIFSSIFDCFVLNIGLVPRILAVGFNIDPTLSNFIWCKIRTYGLRISTLISLYSVCLMSIDRFFITCRTVRWRRMSNISFIQWATIFMTLIICIEGLPFFILTDIIRTNTTITCTPMHNSIFARYASFFCIPVLFGVFPLLVMATMSISIYYKLNKRIYLRKAQRSLTSIILLRILFVIISCGPYTSYFVYTAIISLIVQSKTPERISIENFILNIVSIFLYVSYSSSFFIYYFTSPTYRKKLSRVFTKFRQQQRVYPINDVIHALHERNLAQIPNNHH